MSSRFAAEGGAGPLNPSATDCSGAPGPARLGEGGLKELKGLFKHGWSEVKSAVSSAAAAYKEGRESRGGPGGGSCTGSRTRGTGSRSWA